jgi:uncharacterized integral membrane protein
MFINPPFVSHRERARVRLKISRNVNGNRAFPIITILLVVLLWIILMIFAFVNVTVVNILSIEGLTLIFGVATVLGAGGTIAGIISADKHHKEYMKVLNANKSVRYDDLRKAIYDFTKTFNKLGFGKQDFILAIDAKDATIAAVMRDLLNPDLPVYVGTSVWKDEWETSELRDMLSFKTYKWGIYIPDYIFRFYKQKVLIVHDIALYGDVVTKTKDFLISKGFTEENIKTYCLVAHHRAIKVGVPDFYWIKTDEAEFDFPWGSAR